MFDVDVTTEDPGMSASYGTKICIGGKSRDWLCPSSASECAGGIAFLGAFRNAYLQPAFAFSTPMVSAMWKASIHEGARACARAQERERDRDRETERERQREIGAARAAVLARLASSAAAAAPAAACFFPPHARAPSPKHFINQRHPPAPPPPPPPLRSRPHVWPRPRWAVRGVARRRGVVL